MKTKQKIYRFRRWDCHIILHRYADEAARPALLLVAADTKHNADQDVYPGEAITIATTNLPDEPIPEGCTIIKTWSENEGIFEWLLKENIIQPTGQHRQAGHEMAPVVIINPEFLATAKQIHDEN